jgi:DNA-damage-inducible protein D
MTSCEQSGNIVEDHFPDVGKVIKAGKGATKEWNDYALSRFACYLIAQNGDSRKPEIAAAQAYFGRATLSGG